MFLIRNFESEGPRGQTVRTAARTAVTGETVTKFNESDDRPISGTIFVKL